MRTPVHIYPTVAAQEIGRETVQYVANIYKYYVAYRLATHQAALREEEREQMGLKIEPGPQEPDSSL